MNFELKFSSNKGDFVLNVDSIATLDRTRIPLIYIVPQESTINTTDQAAVQCITRTLLCAPLTRSGETKHALLVQANETRWLLFGRKEVGESGAEVMKIKARIVGGHALTGWTRPTLDNGQSAFLVKKTRSVLDEHQKSRKRRKLSPETLRKPEEASLHKPEEVPERSSSQAAQIKSPAERRKAKDITLPSNKASAKGKAKDSSQLGTVPPLLREESTLELGSGTMHVAVKATRDQLKKMIITLLSLRGITKKSESFKDLYQHTLQAATFALRQTSTVNIQAWEEKAMSINEALLKVFLEPG